MLLNKFILNAKILLLVIFIGLQSSEAQAQSTITQTCNKNTSSMDCLVCNCYYESRGEVFNGKVAVSKVVLSRVASKSYPNNICGVIYQRAQFSWTLGRGSKNISISPRRAGDQRAFRDCQRSADVALQEGANGVLNFYAPNAASPRWARNMNKCGRIGGHIFLTPRGRKCPSLKNLGSNGTGTPKQPSKGNQITKERTKI